MLKCYSISDLIMKSLQEIVFWCEWFLFNVNDKEKNKSVSLDHSGNAEPILMLNQY